VVNRQLDHSIIERISIVKRTSTKLSLLACGFAVAYVSPAALAAPTIFSAAGANPAAIQGTVDNFRNALGAFNAPAPVQNIGGRREIDWDAAPAAVSSPNAFPGGFFNFSSSPRARGISFSTAGTGFQLSGDVDDGTPVRFEDINPTYAAEFQTFSAERLFTPLGSTQVVVNFFSPVDQVTPALSSGLGVVFADVDTLGSTTIDYFDANANLLESVVVPVADKGLSFAGVKFDSSILAFAIINSGDFVIGPDDGMLDYDIVVMDDFIFGEPTVIPEPASLLFASAGGLALMLRRKR